MIICYTIKELLWPWNVLSSVLSNLRLFKDPLRPCMSWKQKPSDAGLFFIQSTFYKSCIMFSPGRAAISKSISLSTVISLTLTTIIITVSITRRSPAFLPSLLSLSPSTCKRLHEVIARVKKKVYWKTETELTTDNKYTEIHWSNTKWLKRSYLFPWGPQILAKDLQQMQS